MGSGVQAPADDAFAPEFGPSDDGITNPEGFLSELLGALKDDDDDDEGDAVEPADQRDDALDQELREIESLRNELSGLRDRLSIGDGAN
jgi:hypothetical protein